MAQGIVAKHSSGSLVVNATSGIDMKTQQNLSIHNDYLTKFDLKEGDKVDYGSYGSHYPYITIYKKL